MKSDKIAEAYMGKIGTPAYQEATRERIHWICSQVKGSTVLDIGCSQGIVPALLGAEGFIVVGIDKNEESIAYGNELVSTEYSEARDNVTFITSDFFEFSTDQKFDTILLTETIEHFFKPERILEAVKQWAHNETIVVITTPFYVHKDPDHKITFTLKSFADLATQYFDLTDLFVEDKYIRAVCKVSEKPALWGVEVLYPIEEQAVFSLEKYYLARQNQLLALNKELSDNVKKTESSLNDAVTDNKKLQNEIKATELAVRKELQNWFDKRVSELSAGKDDYAELNQQQAEQLQELEKDKAELQSKAESLAKNLSKLQARMDSVEKDAEGYKSALCKGENTIADYRVRLSAAEDAKVDLCERLADYEAKAVQLAEVKREFALQGKKKDEALIKQKKLTREAVVKNMEQIDTISDLKAEVIRVSSNYELLRDSFSLRLGQLFVQAVVKPGKNTMLLPFRLCHMLFSGAKTLLTKGVPEPTYIPKQAKRLKKAANIKGQDGVDKAKEQMDNPADSTCPVRIDCKKMTLNESKSVFHKIVTNHGEACALAWLFEPENFIKKHYILMLDFGFFRLEDFDARLKCARRAFELSPSEKRLQRTLALLRKNGEIRSVASLYNEYIDAGHTYSFGVPLENSQAQILNKGFCPAKLPKVEGYKPREKSSFYLLHNSLPYYSNGYATRSHALIQSIRGNGWDVNPITRPGFPTDVKAMAGKLPDYIPPTDLIDGVTYHRLDKGEVFYGGATELYANYYVDCMLPLAEKYNPAVIHGASNHMQGLAAGLLAERLGVPSVYEVRGLWELTRASREEWFMDSEKYQLMSRLEADACNHATAVIAITPGLIDTLVNYGVDRDKIILVPNGVDSTRFVPTDIRDPELIKKYKLQDKVVIGYAGSFVDYEGLDTLIDAVGILKAGGVNNFHLMLVGDGAMYDDLVERVQYLNLQDTITFTGRVPHEDVEKYYSIFDITPFPRRPLPVCEIVSPLKPFEAMAMGKAVLSSDVRALAEIVDDGNTGVLFKKGDVGDLADKLKLLINRPELRHELAERARRWVVAERDWNILSKQVVDLYQNLLN